MFTLQIDSKPISNTEIFGYLLELVNQKVRDWLSNLKPGPEGYKTTKVRMVFDASARPQCISQ